jgi:hypothetical protein
MHPPLPPTRMQDTRGPGRTCILHRVSELVGGSIGVSGQKSGAPSREIRERPGSEPHVEASACPLNRQNLESQLLRQPAPQIGDHNPITREHIQDRVVEGLKGECDSSPRHRDTTQRADLPHPKTDVAVSQPDLRQLEAEPGSNALPDDGHLGSEGIALSPERKIPESIPYCEKLVEEPFHSIQIEGQMEPIPAGKRGRQQIGHGVSIGPRIRNSELGIRNLRSTIVWMLDAPRS